MILHGDTMQVKVRDRSANKKPQHGAPGFVFCCSTFIFFSSFFLGKEDEEEEEEEEKNPSKQRIKADIFCNSIVSHLHSWDKPVLKAAPGWTGPNPKSWAEVGAQGCSPGGDFSEL